MSNYKPGMYYVMGRKDRYNGVGMDGSVPEQHVPEYTTGYTDAENEIVWNTRVMEKVRPFYKTPKDSN
jgi:hypothetical protein